MNLYSINDLKDYQIKNCQYEGLEDDDGQVYQRSESGAEFNIIRWFTHKYTLNLQYLSYEEAEIVIKELIDAKRLEAPIIIPKSKIESKKYIDMKDVKGDPIFFFDLKDCKPSQQVGTSKYNLSLKLKERVENV